MEVVISQCRRYKNQLSKTEAGIILEDSAPLGISKETFELMELMFNEESA
jgi:hypothetical protein